MIYTLHVVVSIARSYALRRQAYDLGYDLRYGLQVFS